MVERALPGANVVSVNDGGELDQTLDRVNLLLVNRVLDGRFDTESGIELIRSCAGRAGCPPVILISNHDDAQAEAEAAGASPGFGKADSNNEEAALRVREAVGISA